MSIHILTTDQAIIKQLSLLLEGGQQPFYFYDDLEALITHLPKLRKTDKVFYDLQLEPTLMAFDALRFGGKKTNIIPFEPLQEGAPSNCPKTASHYLIISSDARKTGARLKKTLHQVNTLAAKTKKVPKKTKSRKTTQTEQPIAAMPPPVTLSRYLTSKSSSMQRVLAEIVKLAKEPKFIFIAGEDGADFELAAKEINFRSNGDQSPLHIADPMRVEIDKLKDQLCKKDTTQYYYLGLSYELGSETVADLNEYLTNPCNEEAINSGPYFILGHIEESESYLEVEVKALIKSFKQVGETLQLPPLAERKEDVSLIAQSIFTILRTAHPFLMTRTMSRSAIEYLESQCAEMSYSSLVSTIRNSMALTPRDKLTEEELRNFGGSVSSAQHLVESFADEKFFENQTGAA